MKLTRKGQFIIHDLLPLWVSFDYCFFLLKKKRRKNKNRSLLLDAKCLHRRYHNKKINWVTVIVRRFQLVQTTYLQENLKMVFSWQHYNCLNSPSNFERMLIIHLCHYLNLILYFSNITYYK